MAWLSDGTQQPPPANERELLDRVYRQVRERLPRSWSIEMEQQPAALRLETGWPTTRRWRPDALFRLRGPDGRAAELLVDAKNTVTSRDVGPMVEQLRLYAATGIAGEREGNLVIAARYLPPTVRALLTEQGLSYVDATGNLRLEVDDPAVFVEREGAKTDPWRQPERELSSLRGKPASRVVRALIDYKTPFAARDLARLATVSIGSTYRTLGYLEREGLVVRDERGTILESNWEAILRRWSEDYEFAKKNELRSYFEPRGAAAAVQRLRGARWEYAVTGSFAAARFAEFAEPRALSLFVREPDLAADALDLRPATSVANVLLATPVDDVVYARCFVAEGVRYAAPSQAAVDLMRGPGRNPSEAEQLIRWMSANTDQWRGRPDAD